MKRGVRGRCPVCAEGKLFRAYLKVNERCAVCGTEFWRFRADDGPAYVTLFIAGHLIVPIMFWVERNYVWPIWLHMLVFLPLTALFMLALLPLTKGGLVGVQVALDIRSDERR